MLHIGKGAQIWPGSLPGVKGTLTPSGCGSDQDDSRVGGFVARIPWEAPPVRRRIIRRDRVREQRLLLQGIAAGAIERGRCRERLPFERCDFSSVLSAGELLLVERKNHTPIVLHVDDGPALGLRGVERFVEPSYARLAVVGPFTHSVV